MWTDDERRTKNGWQTESLEEQGDCARHRGKSVQVPLVFLVRHRLVCEEKLKLKEKQNVKEGMTGRVQERNMAICKGGRG